MLFFYQIRSQRIFSDMLAMFVLGCFDGYNGENGRPLISHARVFFTDRRSFLVLPRNVFTVTIT